MKGCLPTFQPQTRRIQFEEASVVAAVVAGAEGDLVQHQKLSICCCSGHLVWWWWWLSPETEHAGLGPWLYGVTGRVSVSGGAGGDNSSRTVNLLKNHKRMMFSLAKNDWRASNLFYVTVSREGWDSRGSTKKMLITKFVSQ